MLCYACEWIGSETMKKYSEKRKESTKCDASEKAMLKGWKVLWCIFLSKTSLKSSINLLEYVANEK